MTNSPFARKLALFIHVVVSVSWIGALLVYLVLAGAALTSRDIGDIAALSSAMSLAAHRVIVPLSFATLISGVAASLLSPWGVFRHYWVIFKLFLNTFAVIVLMMYLQSLEQFSAFATRATRAPTPADVALLTNPTHVVHSVAALLLLLVATVLAIFKPRGMTRYGWRKQREERVRENTPA